LEQSSLVDCIMGRAPSLPTLALTIQKQLRK
jgi:hypothetical protein